MAHYVRLLFAVLGVSLITAACQTPARRHVPSRPFALISRLAHAALARDFRSISQMLTATCRANCPGFEPRVLSASGGYQIARWVPRTVVERPLIADFARAVLSYSRIERFEFEPLRSRIYHGRVLTRVMLRAAGRDAAGFSRIDQGLIDFELIERAGKWRIERFYPARVHTVRRQSSGYEHDTGKKSYAPPSDTKERRRQLNTLVDLGVVPTALVDIDLDGRPELLVATDSAVMAFRHTCGEQCVLAPQPVVLFAAKLGRLRSLAAADFDGDGRDELVVVGKKGAGIWHQKELRWRPLSQHSGGNFARARIADFDRDGRLDVYLVRNGAGHNLFWWGKDQGGFEVAKHDKSGGDNLDACVLDADGDRRLDIFVAGGLSESRLYRNLGQRRFADVSAKSGLAGLRLSTTCAAADVDGDGLAELYVGSVAARDGHLFGRPGEKTPGVRPWASARRRAAITRARGGGALYINRSRQGGIRFRKRALGALSWARAAGFYDHDNDGDLDLIVARGRFSRALEQLYWRAVAGPTLAGGAPPREVWGRFSSRRQVVYLNASGTRWPAIDKLVRLGVRGSSFAMGDPDGDFGLDVFSKTALFRWTGGKGDLGEDGAQQGLIVRLRSTSPGNRQAIGSPVKLLIEGRPDQHRLVGHASGMPNGVVGDIHFGAGSEVRVNALEVIWPDGERGRYTDLPVQRQVVITQGRGARWAEPKEVKTRADSTDDDGSDDDADNDDDDDDSPKSRPASRLSPTSQRAPSDFGGPPTWSKVLSAAERKRLSAHLGPSAALMLIVPRVCKADCQAYCRRGYRVSGPLIKAKRLRWLVVGSQARAPKACPAPYVRLSPRSVRKLSPIAPATMLIGRFGGVLRIDAGPLGAKQLEADLSR